MYSYSKIPVLFLLQFFYVFRTLTRLYLVFISRCKCGRMKTLAEVYILGEQLNLRIILFNDIALKIQLVLSILHANTTVGVVVNFSLNIEENIYVQRD